ncbi:hypothetical protein [Streptomyces xanthophaeus]|uniref:hypothetical protein n=1 Tax=Streptomyces xanthophaeus TaxID=67385 RepID=UPI001FD76A7E|nr:hypothetical protein [Streptomyces xanthophaeus]
MTLSGEAGPPAASSGTFPAGTKLKVTNLDNGQATTVTVNGPSGSCVLLNNAAFDKVREPGKNLIRRARIGPSGSCVLLNNAAFDKVREPGKNLIRRARIERVGGGDAPTGATGATGASGAASGQAPPATGEVVCPGSTVTLSGEAGPPAASSGTFPAGTKLKVTGPSGSCVLLNNAAFDKVREPGKNLIRRARIERVN